MSYLAFLKAYVSECLCDQLKVCVLCDRGTSGIDIDLQKVDIDQCPLPEGSTELNVFKETDKCKKETTKVSS